MQSIRRSSQDPPHNVDFYPMHDTLDDIHENHQADHQQQQYHTVNGNCPTTAAEKRAIFCDAQRNSIFHTILMDSAASVSVDPFAAVVRARPRFDNTSFSRDLAETVSATTPKEKSSKTSLHGMLKTFGKKTHLWPRRRNESTCAISQHALSPVNDPQEQFRSRSKSLDVNYSSAQHHILNDCDATYKIFDKIVREGNAERERWRFFFV